MAPGDLEARSMRSPWAGSLLADDELLPTACFCGVLAAVVFVVVVAGAEADGKL